MIRKSLSQIPIESGNKFSANASLILVGWILGWASHELSVPMFCWYAA